MDKIMTYGWSKVLGELLKISNDRIVNKAGKIELGLYIIININCYTLNSFYKLVENGCIDVLKSLISAHEMVFDSSGSFIGLEKDDAKIEKIRLHNKFALKIYKLESSKNGIYNYDPAYLYKIHNNSFQMGFSETFIEFGSSKDILQLKSNENFIWFRKA
ncbi:hypothetical protein AYI70_g2893 [Smittium culicis]|uniref:Uncharacterized protein n=1 Tax=Smittium culicis TaxID=133412 RepID=A0A1R1X133_9FUNG|nr:hypothetical protein AYI70_g11595 [Smittium culicis]OMJ22404.1 hypothetical protein AYI70_g2893 [Smittium culicis]